jgi:hypothetical protein
VKGLAFNRSGFNGLFNQNFRLGFAAEFQTQGVHFTQQATLAPTRPAKRLNQRIIVPCELGPICILPHITHYSLLIDSYFEAIMPAIRFKSKHFIVKSVTQGRLLIYKFLSYPLDLFDKNNPD